MWPAAGYQIRKPGVLNLKDLLFPQGEESLKKLTFTMKKSIIHLTLECKVSDRLNIKEIENLVTKIIHNNRYLFSGNPDFYAISEEIIIENEHIIISLPDDTFYKQDVSINIPSELEQTEAMKFEHFLKETDNYIEKLKSGTDTDDDSRRLFSLESGQEGDIGYKRILMRASQYSPMRDTFSLDRIISFRNLVHLHKNCRQAESEWLNLE